MLFALKHVFLLSNVTYITPGWIGVATLPWIAKPAGADGADAASRSVHALLDADACMHAGV